MGSIGVRLSTKRKNLFHGVVVHILLRTIQYITVHTVVIILDT